MKSVVKTNAAPSPIGPYSQAILIGNMLFVSGQIAIDPVSGTMIQSSVSDEARQAMKNIEAILSEAGYSFGHIVKTTIFLLTMDDFAAVNEVYGSFFTSEYPARETVAVAGLPKNGRVEISVIAVKA